MIRQDLKAVPATWSALLQYYKDKCGLSTDAEAEARIAHDLKAGIDVTPVSNRPVSGKPQLQPLAKPPVVKDDKPRSASKPTLEPIPNVQPSVGKLSPTTALAPVHSTVTSGPESVPAEPECASSSSSDSDSDADAPGAIIDCL